MWSAEAVSDCAPLSICGAGEYGTGGVSGAWDVQRLSGLNGAGFLDGPGDTARFDTPYNLMSGQSYVLVADSGNHLIRKVDLLSGYTTTLAGSGTAGYTNGVGILAAFNKPVDVTLDWVETFAYVSDHDNNCIRRIDLVTANVVQYAGMCTSSATISSINLNRGDTRLDQPRGLAVTDDMGWLIVVDSSNVRKINLQSGAVSLVVTLPSASPDHDPLGLDVFGPMVYIAFKAHHKVMQVDWTAASPILTTLAGSGEAELTDAIGTNAAFQNPTGVAVDFHGQSLLVADSLDHTIRLIDLSSTEVSTLVGDGTAGEKDDLYPNAATLWLPYGVSLSRDGKYGVISDQGNHAVRWFRVDSCLECPSGTFSSNGSLTEDYCLPSFCVDNFVPKGVNVKLFEYVGYLTERAGSLLGYEANVQLWLDSSNVDGKFNDDFAGKTYQAVSSWKDLSGKNRHATALSTAAYTTTCKLLPGHGIHFDGDCGFQTTGTSPLNSKTVTIMVVLERTGQDSATQGHVVSGRLSGGTPVQSLGFQTSTRAFYNRDDLSPGTTDSAFSDDPLLNTVVTHDRILLTATTSYNGLVGISEVFVNGNGAGPVTLGHAAGETGSGGTAVIGAAQDLSSNYNFIGFIQEVIVFDIALSTAQLAAMGMYLSKKWKISPHKMNSDNLGATDYYDPMQAVPGCSLCNPGTQVYYGQCSSCPAATYSNDGVMCKVCPKDSTSFSGATSIAQCSCNPGYYRTGLENCQACPAGFYCPAVCS
jgi:hypothetical protein